MSRRETSEADGRKWKEHEKSTAIVKAEKGGWRPPFKKVKGAKFDKMNIWQTLKALKGNQRFTGQKKSGEQVTVYGNYGAEDVNPPPSQIGVDNGLLRNSSTPGYSSAEGGNVFRIDRNERSITVGFNVRYARYFDAVRPLLPSSMPAKWMEGMNDLVRDWLSEQIAG